MDDKGFCFHDGNGFRLATFVVGRDENANVACRFYAEDFCQHDLDAGEILPVTIDAAGHIQRDFSGLMSLAAE